MTALKVVGIILLIFFLIGLIRVGGIAEYSADGFFVWIRAWFLRFQVFPAKEKKPKQKKEKKKKEKPKEEEPKEKKGGAIGPIKAYLPLVGDAAGALIHRIRIDLMELEFISAAEDPAAAAMTFGYSNAAIGMIWPILEKNFTVKKRDLRTGVDFNAKKPTVYLKASFSARIGQLVSFALILGVKLLKIYLKNRPKKTTPESGDRPAPGGNETGGGK